MKPFTPEASAAALASIEAQKLRYTRKFLEDDTWVELAREAKVNLPMFYTRPSDTEIRWWLKTLNVSWETYVEAYGWQNAQHFEQLNPTWGLRGLVGLILELWQEMQHVRRASENSATRRGAVVGSAVPKKKRYPRGLAKAKRPPLDKTVTAETLNKR